MSLFSFNPFHQRCYDFFPPKNLAKILAFFATTFVRFYRTFIVTLVFEKNAIFIAKNWRKSQTIVIITSTPGIVSMMAATRN
jgi:hypothetical protein